jgi:hypothetical protein
LGYGELVHPVIRTFGKLLRLVGISSPEDSAPRAKSADDPPSWRKANDEAQKNKEDTAGD